jgi:Ca-activated chloride channel family protein
MRLLSPGYLLLLFTIPPLVLASLWFQRAKGKGNEKGGGLLPRLRALRESTKGLFSAGGLGLSPARFRLFLTFRIIALVFLVLALAGPVVARSVTGLTVGFLLDESQSVSDSSRAEAVSMIEDVRSRLSPGDRGILVRFAGSAAAEDLVEGVAVKAESSDDLDRGSTDIARAIQLALADMPEEGTRRIVLFSDGNQTRGNAGEAAAIARSFGVEVFDVALPTPPSENEVSVEEILAPERVRAGEPHQVTVLVKSRTRTAARVSLFRDGAPVASTEGFLQPGENPIAVQAIMTTAGLHSYEALVDSPNDRFIENNHFKRFIEVSGDTSVLYVSRKGRASRAFLSALAVQGIPVTARDASGLPGSIEGFVPYDGVILDNVPSYTISYEKMQILEQYVRDVGGGLLMIGGDSSFGAGGYYNTPIEKALPVDMDVKSQLQRPRLSLLILTDKSGSMAGQVTTGEMKLDVVKSAAYAAIDLLNPFDRVGLLAFDADWEWAVPMVEARDKETITEELSTLAPGGGTDLYPALVQALDAISAEPSAVKHIIVISDGLTQPADFERLVTEMAREKITVSTIAVGEDADRDLLADIAEWGKGRAYETNDPMLVPKIFVTETMLVSRSLLVDKSFLPQLVSRGEILKGIPFAGMPPLSGFVLTFLKNGAEEGLRGLYDSPLLASWRYGLGKAAAFTSDLGGGWSRDWVEWEAYPRFVAQLVRWIQRPVSFEVLHPRVSLDAGRGRITVDAYDELGVFVNGLDLIAVVLGPGDGREELVLSQKAPGLYDGTFRAETTGDYALTIAAVNRRELAPRTIGVSIPYLEEYRDAGVNAGLLASMAEATGGSILPLGGEGASAYGDILGREAKRSLEASPLWPYLVLAALLAFFLDIVTRKLSLSEGARARIASLFSVKRGRERYSYGELTLMVSTAKEEQKRMLKQRITRMAKEGRVDPDLAAYLYIARLKGRSRDKEGEKKKG